MKFQNPISSGYLNTKWQFIATGQIEERRRKFNSLMPGSNLTQQGYFIIRESPFRGLGFTCSGTQISV